MEPHLPNADWVKGYFIFLKLYRKTSDHRYWIRLKTVDLNHSLCELQFTKTLQKAVIQSLVLVFNQ